MGLIHWEDKFKLNIPEMDSQHKEMARLVWLVNDLAGKNVNQDLLDEQLDNLLLYTKQHFYDEEELMRKNSFHDLETHQKMHRILFEKINELAQKLKENKLKLSQEVSKYISDWLTTHIIGMDKAYAEFIKKKK